MAFYIFMAIICAIFSVVSFFKNQKGIALFLFICLIYWVFMVALLLM